MMGTNPRAAGGGGMAMPSHAGRACPALTTVVQARGLTFSRRTQDRHLTQSHPSRLCLRLSRRRLEALEQQVGHEVHPFNGQGLGKFVGAGEILLKQLPLEPPRKGGVGGGDVTLLADPEAEVI